ncbi:hypothetical protein IQ266_16730 [filamentous cyanobacterium LEGE 11480]|uniref:Uncharacterized protein n=1 Tax=Romeriopsis navalis LEGE 11480 TaxID=2777977 RepID=A0A928Z3C5_9CYAN|nr:hypothetical protein [Romeriopsis navalis]MBE9031381.1 hypothetical protein [Romeriopsis navalis LEGE 11480]
MITTAPNLLFVWFAGLLLALAFQVILAQFGVAIGLSFTHFLWKPEESENSASAETTSQDNNLSVSNRVISWIAGLGVLLTVDSVLFIASFLAVKLSLSLWPMQGMVIALTIWATYLLLLFWFSTKAINAAGEILFGIIVRPLRQLFQALQTIIQPEDEPEAVESIRAIQAQIKAEVEQFIQQLEGNSQEFDRHEGLSNQHNPQGASTAAPLAFPSQAQKSVTVSTLKTQPSAVKSNWLSQIKDFDWRVAARSLVEQVDLSDVDAQALWSILQEWLQIETLPDAHPQQLEGLSHRQSDIVVTELEEKLQRYLRYTNLDKLTASGIKRKIDQLQASLPSNTKEASLYLPSANTVETLLQNRKGITQSKIQQVVQAIEAERPSPRSSHPEAIVRLYHSLSAIPWHEINLEDYKVRAIEIFDYPPTDLQVISQYLTQLDWPLLAQRLKTSQIMPTIDIDQLLEQLRQLINRSRTVMQLTQQTASQRSSPPTVPKASDDSFKQSLKQVPEAISAAHEKISHKLMDASSELTDYKSGLQQIKQFVSEMSGEIRDALPDILSINQDLPQLYDRLGDNMQQAKSQFEYLQSQVQDLADDPQSALAHLVKQAQHELLQPLHSLEESLNEKADQLNHHLKTQLKSVQKLAIVAAWWIFFISFSSGLSAACAGWLAAGGRLPNVEIIVAQLSQLIANLIA